MSRSTVPAVNTHSDADDSSAPRSAAASPVAARIVSVGDELLSGDTVNTNATAMAEACRRLGVVVEQVVTVRDRIEEIVAAVQGAAGSADVCFVSGGLGPTTDDRTTEAVAAAAGVEVIRDAAALARIEGKFAAMGYTMAPMNAKQADFPAGATIVPNPIGTAEGYVVPVAGCPVFVTPGVPREMKKMFAEQITPQLRERFALQAVPRRMYRALGRGESSLAKVVEPIVEAARGRSPGLASVFVHYRASTPEVLVILEGTAGTSGQAATHEELESLDAEIAAAMEPALYGIGEDTLPARVVEALRAAGLTLCVAESCTAGGTGRTVTSVPGSSAVFVGGVVAYSNALKTALLGVDEALLEAHGAVSEPVAKAMAEGARAATRSDLCVAITGIAGPGGGSAEKPVGTVHIDVFDGEAHLHKKLKLRGNRGTVRHCAELWALKLVWDRLHVRGLASVHPAGLPAGT
ncbi:MAG: CinA family nicotinamide mononucleotide deamidase-related protein [Myxococcota bacterium]